MIEIPEAATLARQIAERCTGKTVQSVTAGSSPHKFVWYYGERERYAELARGRTVTGASSAGGFVVAELGDMRLAFSEGFSVRAHDPGAKRPAKHQLLVDFTDGSSLSASAQMYGGTGFFLEGTFDNPYYLGSMQKPSPLSGDFDRAYFASILEALASPAKVSAKALLATEQRIPGLGNGVLQDILLGAGIHPRRRAGTFAPKDVDRLYESVVSTLRAMTDAGGRDTELDLYGRPGGYRTRLSRLTAGTACTCGATIEKASYLGGSIYFCPRCQPEQ